MNAAACAATAAATASFAWPTFMQPMPPAKSIAGGLPLSSITGRAEVMDAPGVGGLGGTFGGNPIALAAAHAVLDQFEKGDILAKANRIGATFQARAAGWTKRFPLIGEVRGVGAMWAVELVKDR